MITEYEVDSDWYKADDPLAIAIEEAANYNNGVADLSVLIDEGVSSLIVEVVE